MPASVLEPYGEFSSASPSISRSDDGQDTTSLNTTASSTSLQHGGEVMKLTAFSDYIPLGCLCLPAAVRELYPFRFWQEIDFTSEDSYLLLQHVHCPKPLQTLWQARVVRVVVGRPREEGPTILRLYVLADDRRAAGRNARISRNHLESLLQEIDTSSETWNGHDTSKKQSFDPWATAAQSSLYYLFNTLPSPSPCKSRVPDRYTRLVMQELLDDEHLAGLKSTLYPYQRRTVAAMLEREVSPSLHLDPRLEERTAPDGSNYYYTPRGTTFLRVPHMYESTKSGILAETMGLGKTIICLSLILSTRGHMPQVPAHSGIERARTRTRGPPSLIDLTLATAAKHALPVKSHFARLQRETGVDMSQCLRESDCRPPEYSIPHQPTRTKRRLETPQPTKKRLCSATIVVVPKNLVHQWKSEVAKHVEPDVLSMLVVDSSKIALPAATKLAEYDIILFSKSRFERESRDGSDKYGRTLTNVPSNCRCPYIGNTRTIECTCLKINDIYSSPLKELHWFRIIVDEGHEFSSKSSDAVRVAEKLVTADRRWVVSGTPGKHRLFGVEVDLAAQADPDQLPSELFESDGSTTPSSIGTYPDIDASLRRQIALQNRRKYNLQEEKTGAATSLGLLASNFLKVRPWAESDGQKVEWDDFIYRHESYRARTYTSFSTCLQRTLESLVIKTRPEDVDMDIILPPLHHHTILLEPSFYDRLTANLFVLFLTANAVTSERTDVDYLFHKNSVKSRNQLLTNLRQSAFYWTGFSEDDVSSAVRHSERYLLRPDTRCTPEDRELLGSCMEFARFVLSCQTWRNISRAHEIGFFIENWPEGANPFAWSLTDLEPSMIGSTQLRAAQDFLNERLFDVDPVNGMSAAGEAAMRVAYSVEQIPREKRKKYDNSSGREDHVESQESEIDTRMGLPLSGLHHQPKYRSYGSSAKSSPGQARQNTKSQQPKDSGPNELGSGGVEQLPLSPKISRKRKQSMDKKKLSSDSPLAKASIIGTTSAKLSYLLCRVMELYKQEKILIFYDGDNTAFYIAQCLEIVHIKHLIYAKSLTQELKSKYVVTFDQDPSIRVLLMDIRCGALGLNVNAASRVFFVNPPCRPFLEAQGIKRCHRIGQTRPVYVETLVLRGTVEEKLFERSKKMSRQEHADATQLYDDQGICSIVQNARMLPVSSADSHAYNQCAPLRDGMRIQIFGRKGRGDTRIIGIDRAAEVESPDQKRPAKRPRKNGILQTTKDDERSMLTATGPGRPLLAPPIASSTVAAALTATHTASGITVPSGLPDGRSIFG